MNLLNLARDRAAPGAPPAGMAAMRRRRFPPLLLLGVALAALLVGAVLLAPWITPHHPAAQRPALRLLPPSAASPLGTDRYGRDMLARMLYGGRTTLLVCGAALAAAVTLGVGVGVLAGYAGGWPDRAARMLIDVLLAFPSTILALVVVGLFGPGLANLLLALVSVWWVGFARLARSLVLALKHETVIEAARSLGARPLTIIRHELLPRILGPVAVLAALELGHLVLTVAALSYLGLGAQPPAPEWGALLADSRAFTSRAPHLLLAPGLAVLLTVLALNCIGEGLRDWLDAPGMERAV